MPSLRLWFLMVLPFALWGTAIAVAMAVVAVSSPLVGALAATSCHAAALRDAPLQKLNQPADGTLLAEGATLGK